MSDFPLPDTQWPPARPFWEAAAEGRLAIPRCEACALWVWYPRERCPGCAGAAMPWIPVSGRGALFSWTTVRHVFVPAFADRVPYTTGLVALEEDPAVRLVTTLVDCEPDALRVDLPMQAVFRPLTFPEASRSVVAPFFAPAG